MAGRGIKPKRENKMNVAVIVSGGVGKRFGEDVPKQYQEIEGKKIISFVIDAVKNAKTIDKVIVSAHSEYKDLISNIYGVEWVEAGSERNITLHNALKHIKINYACDNIIVLDAVMPLINSTTIDSYIKLLDEHQVIVTAQKITVSLGCYDLHEVDRERYYLMSSPEAFKFELLYKYMNPNSPLVEVTQQFPKGIDIFLNFDFVNNTKIVYKKDLRLIHYMLKDEGLI
jgi:2-C-methyl-D-erythritol 4-phosphate cytidylyltransferase